MLSLLREWIAARSYFLITPSPEPPRRTEQGAVLVEASMSIGVFFLLIFCGCELMRLGYNAMSAQYAVAGALRQAILGGPATGIERGASVEKDVIERAAALGINLGLPDVDSPHVVVCSASAADCSSASNAGGENDLVSIRIRYPIQLLFGLASYTIDVTVMGRNEPFRSV